MRDRLDDPEVTSIIGSIIQGEILGTPLARLFRTQADVLRTKRTQRAETIAGEAGVKLTPAGSTFPLRHDPNDSNIRLAPTYPSLAELHEAMPVFVTATKLAAVRQRLDD